MAFDFNAFKNRSSIGTVFCLACVLLISACGTSRPIDPEYFIIGQEKYTTQNFPVCHGYACALHSYASFSDEEWKNITALLKPAAESAKQERGNIAKAVALMERYSGEKAGTKTDVAKATFKMIDRKQQDCIDETVNTNMYLTFLDQEELIQWHSIDKPIRRGYFIDGAWPHNTATIRDKETGQVYTVDSWFGANGEEPYIIPAETWLDGWDPSEETSG